MLDLDSLLKQIILFFEELISTFLHDVFADADHLSLLSIHYSICKPHLRTEGYIASALTETVVYTGHQDQNMGKRYMVVQGLLREEAEYTLEVQRSEMVCCGQKLSRQVLRWWQGHLQWKVKKKELVLFSALYPSYSEHP